MHGFRKPEKPVRFRHWPPLCGDCEVTAAYEIVNLGVRVRVPSFPPFRVGLPTGQERVF